jgi:hypothetical protein
MPPNLIIALGWERTCLERLGRNIKSPSPCTPPSRRCGFPPAAPSICSGWPVSGWPARADPLDPLPAAEQSALPPALAALMDDALACDQGRRPADGAELHQRLHAVADAEWGPTLVQRTRFRWLRIRDPPRPMNVQRPMGMDGQSQGLPPDSSESV